MKHPFKIISLFVLLVSLAASWLALNCLAVGAAVFEHCEIKSKTAVEIVSAPGTGGKTVATYNPGDIVIRSVRGASKKGGKIWDRILLPDGSEGYIVSDCLSNPDGNNLVSLKKTSIKIGVNESLDLKHFFDAEKSNDIQYYSSDKNILSVTESGIIKGISVGKAEIGVLIGENFAKLSVSVQKEPEGMTLNQEYVELESGGTVDLDSYCQDGYSYQRKYTSSDSSIACVDSKGTVTGISYGTVSITVTAYNGIIAVCKIRVCKNPVTITITNSNNIIQKGSDNHLVTYILSNGSAVKKVSFSVEDTSIAKVSKKGYITGLKKGTTTLTVKTDSGIKASCEIKVENDSMQLNANSTQLSLDLANVCKTVYGTSYQGRNLEAFTITNANKAGYKRTLFIDFAIHGFEDEDYRDANVLVNEANALIDYFAKHSDELGDFRLVIVPCANPDGAIAGNNNLRKGKTAFGRCTANHIDMNRDFKRFHARETAALKDIIAISQPAVYLNIHGWDDEALGDIFPSKIVAKHLGLKRVRNVYGETKGYAIGWVHENLGIPVCLVEYSSPDKVYTKNDINMIKAIIDSYS